MTVPTVVITLVAGSVADIAVSHQVRVIVLDRDVDGVLEKDISLVSEDKAIVRDVGLLPDDEQLLFISGVVSDVEAGPRVNPEASP